MFQHTFWAVINAVWWSDLRFSISDSFWNKFANANKSSPRLFLFFFFRWSDSLKFWIKQPQSYLKNQKKKKKIIRKFYFMQYLWVSCKSYISLKAVARGCSINKMFFKISQNSLENTCARVSFIIMLRAVASVPCQVYIKDKILTHVRHFLFSFAAFWSSLWKFDFAFTLWCWYQKRIKNPAKNPRWCFLQN